MTVLRAKTALLADGWASDVEVTITDGRISGLAAGRPGPGALGCLLATVFTSPMGNLEIGSMLLAGVQGGLLLLALGNSGFRCGFRFGCRLHRRKLLRRATALSCRTPPGLLPATLPDWLPPLLTTHLPAP